MKKFAFYYIFFALLSISCTQPPNEQKEGIAEIQGSMKTAFEETLFRLDSALISLQIRNEGDPDFGALWCPHCNLYHTRAAEAVYPFAYQYALQGDTNYRDAAINLGNWLIAQQEADGSWKETPEEWTGTTTDQLLMMAQAYPLLEKDLDDAVRKAWMNSMASAGNYLVKVMDPGFASINYVATTSATMAVLNLLIPDPDYEDKARVLAHQVVDKMDSDHFITGEGGRVNGVKYGVDLTYNMEMSLWGLALYAKISGDEEVMEQVEASLERHLWFINPDGSMDGSWGIRSNKWTCFGGATSDGSQVLFSLLAASNPAYRTAALRNLNYLQQCMVDGFVGYGPQHREALGAPPCIYPTFAKAKNLAMAHDLYTENNNSKNGSNHKGSPGFATASLPADKPGLEYFPTLDVYRVRTSNFMATVTAYSYKDPRGPRSKYMFRPTGGAISALWLKDYGFLQASSQSEYHRWEPMHFPEMDNIRPLTPRIEYTTMEARAGYYTNLYEFDAESSFEETDQGYMVLASGQLKNRMQESGGVSYGYRYVFEDNRVEKQVRLCFHENMDTIRIIEPVITFEESSVEQAGERTVIILMGESRVRFRLISGNATLSCGRNQDQYRSVYPALTACPIEMTVIPDGNGDTEKIVYAFEIVHSK